MQQFGSRLNERVGAGAREQRVTRNSNLATRWTLLVATFAGLAMAIVVEVYYSDLAPEAALPHRAHFQAFAAACGGFLPTMLFLERLRTSSWRRAFWITGPWFLLVPDVVTSSELQPPWFVVVLITLALIAAAWMAMQQIVRRSEHP